MWFIYTLPVAAIIFCEIASARGMMGIICEGNSGNISCSRGYLMVESAFYGRDDETTCGSAEESQCFSDGAFDIISAHCNCRPSCSIIASDAIFEDPCPSSFEYARVQYRCTSLQACSRTTTIESATTSTSGESPSTSRSYSASVDVTANSSSANSTANITESNEAQDRSSVVVVAVPVTVVVVLLIIAAALLLYSRKCIRVCWPLLPSKIPRAPASSLEAGRRAAQENPYVNEEFKEVDSVIYNVDDDATNAANAQTTSPSNVAAAAQSPSNGTGDDSSEKDRENVYELASDPADLYSKVNKATKNYRAGDAVHGDMDKPEAREAQQVENILYKSYGDEDE